MSSVGRTSDRWAQQYLSIYGLAAVASDPFEALQSSLFAPDETASDQS